MEDSSALPSLPVFSSASTSTSSSSSKAATAVAPTPRKRITTDRDVTRWLEQSEACAFLQTFILRLNRAVIGKRTDAPCSESEPVRRLCDMLRRLKGDIELYPPQASPQRFGNKAFRSWHEHVERNADDMLETVIGTSGTSRGDEPTVSELLPELRAHLLASFGSAQRLDFGTGHEMSFIILLLCLRLRGILRDDDESAIVRRVFVAYLELVWALQGTYNLEPAGSKGVWGLDDHHHLNYLWGAAQMIGQDEDSPSIVFDSAKALRELQPLSITFPSVLHLLALKSPDRHPVAFSAHSPVLHQVHSTVPHWRKLNEGLWKMYKGEVLAKQPVVQHLVFGETFRWRAREDLGGEELESDVDRIAEDGEQHKVPAPAMAPTAMPAGLPPPSLFATARPGASSRR